MVTSNEPEIVESEAPAPLEELLPGFKSVAWLLEHPDSHYTLQLLAVSERQSITKFVKKHKLSGDLVLLESEKNGKNLYSLLFGQYSSRDSAVKARQKLPKSYKASTAWPRSVGSVRKIVAGN